MKLLFGAGFQPGTLVILLKYENEESNELNAILKCFKNKMKWKSNIKAFNPSCVEFFLHTWLIEGVVHLPVSNLNFHIWYEVKYRTSNNPW